MYSNSEGILKTVLYVKNIMYYKLKKDKGQKTVSSMSFDKPVLKYESHRKILIKIQADDKGCVTARQLNTIMLYFYIISFAAV